MRMRFVVVVATRAAKKVSNSLRILGLSHRFFPAAIAVDTSDAGVHAEARAASHASAGCYGGSEHVCVLAVVVAKDELVQIERQILARDIVIRVEDAALQQ